jgi:hypothetical protein
MKAKTVLRSILGALSGVVVVLVITGCATIIHGGSQQINITSTPEGAQVTIFDSSNHQIWSSDTTPAVAKLRRGEEYFGGASYRIEISKPGYQKEIVTVSSSMNGWYLVGNLFVGGLIGWLIIDPVTGAMWTLSPSNVSQSLNKSPSAGTSSTGEITVLLKQSIDPGILGSLDLVRVN